ncbi:MAG: AsmA family protein [Burkholderiaceae bacterium]
MTRQRRIITLALATLGVLLLCGVAAVKLLLDEERLAAFARERVTASLGRELTLDELSLQFSPLPTVHLKNAALANPSWAKEAYFLHADSATARLDLISLLRGKLEIASLSIDGLTTNLEVSARDHKTWQMRDEPADRESGSALVAPLHLTSVQLKNSRIRFARHGEAMREWQIEELRARADSGWRDVDIDGRIVQNGIPLEAKARFADLSRIGQENAVSDGQVELALGKSRLTIEGKLPLSGSLPGHEFKAAFQAESFKELLGFFGLPDIALAPVKASLTLQGGESAILANNLLFQIGHLKVAGNAEIHVADGKKYYRARLTSEYLDWAQTLRDFGRPELPPKPPGQLFRDTPLGWRAVSALQSVQSIIDLNIERVKLRSGIELKDLKANINADERFLNVGEFSFFMLDRRGAGSLILEGDKRTAKLNFDASKVSLGKWLAARGHKLALSGGPTDIKARLSAKGLSMRDLAESMTGPVRISVGPAKLHSKQIQQAETWLIGLAPAFSATETEYVNLACVSAYLPFENGRAAAEGIVGVRSDASQLLASGYIDFRQQALDLRGQVRARSGVSLGVSNIAGGNLKLAGRIDKPSVGLDPESTPGALARIGAAIMTSGVSLLATAIWDAANPASDPCQITFSAHEKKSAPGPRNKVAAKKMETSAESDAYP